MPIDWNAVQDTTGSTPDSSVIQGTKPLPMPGVVGAVGASSGSALGVNLPKPAAMDVTAEPEQLPYTPDYSILEGMGAGLQDTAVSALWHAYDDPDFDYDSTFKSNEALSYLEKTRGAEFDDNQKEKLLKSGSKEEFDFQYQRILDAQTNNEIASQEMTGYLLGSLVDVDTVVGGGLGKVPKLARMSKMARVGIQGAGTAAASAGAYGLDKYTPLSQAEIAFQVSAITAAGLLVPALTKTAPPIVITKGAD